MSHKNVITLGLVLSLLVLGIPTVLAEESTGYNMIGDITPVLTFQFRDGTETYEFPVFQMNENVVDNSGVSFSVEGTVDKSPLLHEVMDEAYKYRLSNAAFDYQLKYFDVNADFMKNGESVISLDYRACRVDNYQIETLDSNDFESYFKEIGFAIVDKIDFVCSGVNSNNEFSMPTEPLTDFGESEFIFASDMRTSVTFLYDDGAETNDRSSHVTCKYKFRFTKIS